MTCNSCTHEGFNFCQQVIPVIHICYISLVLSYFHRVTYIASCRCCCVSICVNMYLWFGNCVRHIVCVIESANVSSFSAQHNCKKAILICRCLSGLFLWPMLLIWTIKNDFIGGLGLVILDFKLKRLGFRNEVCPPQMILYPNQLLDFHLEVWQNRKWLVVVA